MPMPPRALPPNLTCRPSAIVGAILGTFVALVVAAPTAQADPKGRVTVIEENDSLYFPSDKHYTQGLRLSYLSPDLDAASWWQAPFGLLDQWSPGFSGAAGDRSRRFALSFGQSLFTPKDTDRSPPDPRDRPYAGWLYFGASLLQETDQRTLDHVELQLGVVGPAALGEQTQNTFHELRAISKARGWGTQLQNEPGLVASYEKRWRLPLIGDGSNGIDIVPELGATVGNIFTYGETGAMLRFGKNLRADYGPARIRPAVSGTDYFNADRLDGDLGFYGFIGVQGRAVARNVFLDGNSFRQSRSVDKEPLVGDLQAGFSVFWSDAWRFDATAVRRTREFTTQGNADIIGTAGLSFSW